MEVTLGIYTSLCQYFSEQEKRWKTEGIIPLEETRPDQAVCLTQHLTAFGASLFVPPNSVQFVFPVSKTKQRLRCHALSRLLSARGKPQLLLASRSGWIVADPCPAGRPAQVLGAFGSCWRGAMSSGCGSWLQLLRTDLCRWL